jgi:hypothetical protein
METEREKRFRRAVKSLQQPLCVFLPELNVLEPEKVSPAFMRSARNEQQHSTKKARYKQFVLAVQKIRLTRRLSRFDTIAAIRSAVQELQYVRRQIIKDESNAEIEAFISAVSRKLT